MKNIFYFIIALSITSISVAQNKKVTLYYPDSTRVVNIGGLDSMTIFICGASKVSYGGKEYNTVLIGSQCWLKENLDIGTMINSSLNSSNNEVIEKYCYYNNPANCTTYGGLYQWNEAMQYVTNEGSRGICPEGWHVPTLSEYNTLSTSVGGYSNSLKAIGQGTGGGAGTNTSGFSAMISGYYQSNFFGSLGLEGFFWSSTEFNSTFPYYLFLYYYDNNIYFFAGHYKSNGLSVRCIMD